MGRKAVTIRDVAQRAGVGVSTVSYVLNGHDNHVSAATRELILAAARDLKYRPNAIARSMVRRKTASIGLIITELQNALFIPVTEGVEEVLRTEGYHILLASAGDVAGEIEAIETMHAQQVDGFIIMSLSRRFSTDHLYQLRDTGIPFVIINRDLQTDDFSQVQFNESEAGRIATEHLLSLGHRDVAIITGPMDESSPNHRRSAVQRYSGWQTALQERSLPIPESLIFNGNYTFEGGYEAGKQLAARLKKHDTHDPRPTACFVSSDMMAVGTLKALHDSGFTVPRDIAIIAIGDPPFAPYTIPALSTLTLPILEAGQVAARMLVAALKAENPVDPQCITLGLKLRIRESCGALGST
jgi:LacI family transcriptional regulator